VPGLGSWSWSWSWRVEFADIVARLDLSWLIARYELYKLEKQRDWWEASTAFACLGTSTSTRRARGKCRRQEVAAQDDCSCR